MRPKDHNAHLSRLAQTELTVTQQYTTYCIEMPTYHFNKLQLCCGWKDPIAIFRSVIIQFK